MKNFQKVYKIYGSTGGLLVVFVILTFSLFFVLFGPRPNLSKNVDVKVASITKNAKTHIQSANCDADTTIDAQEQQMINDINNFRAGKGLSQLKVSTNLERSSTWFGRDMGVNHVAIPATQGYTTDPHPHIDSLGRDIAPRKADCGYNDNTYYENITYVAGGSSDTDVDTAFQSWVNSAGHNKTMSTPGLVMMGVAKYVATDPTYGKITYWVADFGTMDDGTSGGGGSGMVATPTSCGADGKWTVHFSWTTAGLGLPAGANVDSIYVDLKHDDATPWDNPDGTSNFVSNGPLSGAATSVDWSGINPSEQDVWRVNAHNITDDAWYGFANTSSFSTGACNGTTGGPTANPTGGTQTYNLTANLDKQSYNPGDTMVLCYHMSPENVPFHVVLLESVNGDNPQQAGTWDDDGAGGGACASLTLDATAPAGTRDFTLRATINSQTVEAHASANVTAASTSPSVSPGTTATGSPGVSPSVSPGITITGSPAVSPSSSPTPSNTPVPSATGSPTNPPATATNTPAPQQSNLDLTLYSQGIGTNTAAGQNPNPVVITREVAVRVLDNNGNSVQDTKGNLAIQNTNGKIFWHGTVALTAPNGNYTIKVRFDNTLWKNLGAATLAAGQTTTLGAATLASGDLSGDNTLDLADYNIFLSCYGTKSCSQKQQADLNLDGKADETDLNIFYANLANREGD